MLARSAVILEATTDVVAMADPAGRLLYLNGTGRQLLGLGLDEPLGQKTMAELHPTWAYQVVLHEAFPTALSEGSWSGETALASGNGSELPVLQVVLAHQGADGEVEFLSTICRDITDRKQRDLERIEWA
ncbi:MAG: PAS domain-containing protein, partial [Chthoniobacteraceae bacterium]